MKNPSRERVQSFAKNGLQVEVFAGIFENQNWNSKLVSLVNQFVDSDKQNWSLAERGLARTAVSGKSLDPKIGIVLGGGLHPCMAMVMGGRQLYRKRHQAKVGQLLARIQGRGDLSAWIAIYARADLSADAAAAALEEFTHDMNDSLERGLIIPTSH